MGDDMRFDTDNRNEFAGIHQTRRERFDLTEWLVKKGFAKNVKQAQYGLLGICVVCVLISVFLLHRGSGPDTSKNKLGAPRHLPL